MTHRERFIRTLKCEDIGGQVPTFELVFFLTMERFGRIHHSHRRFDQWNQMSKSEQTLHIKDMADLYIQTAKAYDHSAIFVHPNIGSGPDYMNATCWLLEEIRAQSGDEYYLMMHGDPTFSIPDGGNMMEFAEQMYEEPEKLQEISKRRLEGCIETAETLHQRGHLLDGFCLCADYCFNVNPFFTNELFEDLIVPYLKGALDEYRKLGYYSIKHTDGNIMPILEQMAGCGPDAIHSLDPQGGVTITAVREIIGNDICLVGNVNCGLLQTGTDEECAADVMRSLREGMADGRGYVFSTSNCAYTGLPLERYEMMNDLWKKHGHYDA